MHRVVDPRLKTGATIGKRPTSLIPVRFQNLFAGLLVCAENSTQQLAPYILLLLNAHLCRGWGGEGERATSDGYQKTDFH